MKRSIEEQQKLLLETLKSEYDSDSDNDSIYACSECGHTNKYEKEPYPSAIIAKIYDYPFLQKPDINIKLNLIYSDDFSKLKQVRIEYLDNEIQIEENYYAEREEDIELYQSKYNPTDFNFYYKNGNIIKKLGFSVDTHMYNRLFGSYIRTYDNKEKYFPYKMSQEWKIIEMEFNLKK